MLDAIPSVPNANGDALQAGLPDMGGLLEDFAQRNPNMAWMAQMLLAQRQAQASASPPGDDPRQGELDVLHEALAHSRGRNARLERLVRGLAEDLKQAQSLLADLAAAFGACGLCWGEDTHCPSCRGRGKPGRFAPDPELRLRFFSQALPGLSADGPVQALPLFEQGARTRMPLPPDHSERR